jgi:hypothetical protein
MGRDARCGLAGLPPRAACSPTAPRYVQGARVRLGAAARSTLAPCVALSPRCQPAMTCATPLRRGCPCRRCAAHSPRTPGSPRAIARRDAHRRNIRRVEVSIVSSVYRTVQGPPLGRYEPVGECSALTEREAASSRILSAHSSELRTMALHEDSCPASVDTHRDRARSPPPPHRLSPVALGTRTLRHNGWTGGREIRQLI